MNAFCFCAAFILFGWGIIAFPSFSGPFFFFVPSFYSVVGFGLDWPPEPRRIRGEQQIQSTLSNLNELQLAGS
jgi:hypothetical protein